MEVSPKVNRKSSSENLLLLSRIIHVRQRCLSFKSSERFLYSLGLRSFMCLLSIFSCKLLVKSLQNVSKNRENANGLTRHHLERCNQSELQLLSLNTIDLVSCEICRISVFWNKGRIMEITTWSGLVNPELRTDLSCNSMIGCWLWTSVVTTLWHYPPSLPTLIMLLLFVL